VRQSAERLKRAARDEGFELVGVCDAVPPPHLDAYLSWVAAGRQAGMGYMERNAHVRADPALLLPGAKSILAAGMNYAPPPSIALPKTGRVARYALARDYHKVLRGKLRKVGESLSSDHPESTWRVVVDSAPILEREYAHLAGLGWFGKNTCLINTKRGSWFVLGFLLTDVAFAADEPAIGGCGTCTLCIDACPTGALVVQPDRPVCVVDSNRCISYLTIEHRGVFSDGQREMVGEWLFGCDVCQEVCPFNQPRESQPLRAAETTEADFFPRPENVLLSAEEVLAMDEREFVKRFAGSPLMRAGYAGMRRNAAATLTVRSRRIEDR
jgi:epoxyqueuosine reductase